MPAPAAIQKATLDKYIEGWKAWTPEKSLETWSDDVTFKTLPFSAGKPIRTRQQLEPRYVMLIENLTNFQASIQIFKHTCEKKRLTAGSLISIMLSMTRNKARLQSMPL